ncbi:MULTISPECIES: PQQ-binding-like beta-propeller repeat protein [Asticcacaulis]|uniref:outer membrane protein assembly factor BamB family protein n=1 Tax=Asticcacaulis TaxID=76890 RepID=UPI001AE18928|nr:MULTISPECIES: PQQ-binding-like beta-propeller repeat protein [Asticcacaulis]MBP2158733.1 outer membrane protein assembly factor BamB [Asticcacaulis solisilvae]MDR6799779.1 outer membrane protein assembly factor BamB [Asticcacaulis sp. BE141]
MKPLITALVLSCVAFGARAEDWPTFMHDAARSGRVEAARIRDLKLSRTRALHAPVSASPVVANGRLFVAAENGNLYALDMTTLKVAWLFHSEGAIASTPAVADGRVHFLSRDGVFYALSLDGQLLWRFRTGGEHRFAAVGGYGLDASLGPVPDPWDLYQSSPLVRDGVVYFGSSDGHVRALDAATGKLLWAHDAVDPIHSSPAWADGKIVVGTWGTRLLALDAKTGVEAWAFQGGADHKMSVMLGITAAPSVDGDTVYAGARDGFVYALNAGTGAVKWKYDASGSWVLATAAIDDRNIYFGTSDTGLLVALDKHTGHERFRSRTGVWTYASPVVAGRSVITGTMTGALYTFDTETGETTWTWRTPESRLDVDDILDDAGKLRDARLFGPGRQLQAGVEEVKALGAFVASPILVDGRLIAVTATGEVLVFEAR